MDEEEIERAAGKTITFICYDALLPSSAVVRFEARTNATPAAGDIVCYDGRVYRVVRLLHSVSGVHGRGPDYPVCFSFVQCRYCGEDTPVDGDTTRLLLELQRDDTK